MFPSSKEKAGWWVGVTNNVGDSMTYKVLTQESQQIIHRRVLRPAKDDRFKKKCIRLEPDPDPIPDDSEPKVESGALTFGQRWLKIDLGLSKRMKRKQIRWQQRRPISDSCVPNATQSSSVSAATDTDENGGDTSALDEEDDAADGDDDDVAEGSKDAIDEENDAEEGDGNDGENAEGNDNSTLVEENDSNANTDSLANETKQTSPSVHRSSHQKRTADRMNLTTKTKHGSINPS